MNHSLVFFLQVFTAVDEYNVICVWITRNVRSSVAEELTVCIFCRLSEDGGSVSSEQYPSHIVMCLCGKTQSQCLLDCK